jgi:hypothetical protein
MSEHSRRNKLINAAVAFCDAFSAKKPPDEIFSLFSESEDLIVLEHGLPDLAPFLGREFRGRKGLEEYFGLLASTLSYADMKFSNFLADIEEQKVSVRGEARFTWKSTGQSWDEVFTYVLGFDGLIDTKVISYEIWADSGAAYLASRGELKESKRPD